MKYYGNITNSKDMVDKNYVDTNGGTVNNGKLQVNIDSSESSNVVFTANQSTDSTINFIAGTGISLSKAENNSTTSITIATSGGASTPTHTAVNTIVNVPINKKNVVATIDKGEYLSFNGLSASDAGLEMNLYVLAPVAAGGGSGTVMINNTINSFPVIYCGTYNSSSSTITINLVTNVQGSGDKLEITSRTAANFHIFFNGSILFIDRYNYSGSVN